MPKKKQEDSTKAALATSRKAPAKKKPLDAPDDVVAIRKEIVAFFKTRDDNDRPLGNYKCGIYAFYDYDGEPIYVGQTYEGLSSRIGRHLTNQRTDAVAMNVLDPFEVADVRVWPLNLSNMNKKQKRIFLDRAEFTIFQEVISESKLGAILNEKAPRKTEVVELPKSYARRIIPESIFPQRKHPDVRIARRASTIASLARRISERNVQRGLRMTLVTQAKRLERLAEDRLKEFSQGGAEKAAEK